MHWWRTFVQWFFSRFSSAPRSTRRIIATQWSLSDCHNNKADQTHSTFLEIEIPIDPLLQRDAPPSFKITHFPSDRLH